jgi:hypothetical protein
MNGARGGRPSNAPPDYVFLQIVDILSEHSLRQLKKPPDSDPGTRDRDAV